MTDLRKRSGLDEKERDDNTRIIIVEPEGVPDLVVESNGSGIDSSYVKGVGKLGDGRLLILLDLEKVLAASYVHFEPRIRGGPRSFLFLSADKTDKPSLNFLLASDRFSPILRLLAFASMMEISLR